MPSVVQSVLVLKQMLDQSAPIVVVCVAGDWYPQLHDSPSWTPTLLHRNGMFDFGQCSCKRRLLYRLMSLASALPWWMYNSLTCTLQAQRGLTGIMNYTNPGAVSHNEILQMYKDYIDPEFKWSNFTVEEQSKVIVAARSNNLLDTKRVRLVHQPFKYAALPCTDISCWQFVWLCTDWEGIPSNSVNPWLSEEVCIWAQCKEQASSACSC